MMYGQLCTEFYNADKPFAQAEELQLYQKLFSEKDNLLEPMCGSGRLLIPLVQAGFKVTGFDHSLGMLASCQQRAKALNFNPSLYQASIANFLPEILYQGIIIPLGSLQLLYPRAEAYNALNKFHAWLVHQGKLVLDFFIRWESLYEHGALASSTHQVTLTTGEIIKVNHQITVDKYEQHMLCESYYAKFLEEQLIMEEHEQIDILWYYLYEIELMLKVHGFTVIGKVQRFLNATDHFTFIAEKRAN